MINKKTINEFFPEITSPDFKCLNIGLISNHDFKSMLSFLENEDSLTNLVLNKNIKAVLCTEKIATKLPLKYVKIICDDPKYYFFTLHNILNKKAYKKTKNIIENSAVIHPSANISSHNVKIGKNVKIGENVTIKSDVEIGNNCVISTGAILGQEGFEYKKTSKGIILVKHNKKTIISNSVYIGANCIIDKGIYRNTYIGNNVKIESNTHITHASKIGDNVLIASSSVLCGSVTIKDNVWIGPRCVISNNINVGEYANISIGSVVCSDVPRNKKVFGNPAILNYIKFFK